MSKTIRNIRPDKLNYKRRIELDPVYREGRLRSMGNGARAERNILRPDYKEMYIPKRVTYYWGMQFNGHHPRKLVIQKCRKKERCARKREAEFEIAMSE